MSQKLATAATVAAAARNLKAPTTRSTNAATSSGSLDGPSSAESVVVGVRVRPFNARERDLNCECCILMDGPMTKIITPHAEEAGLRTDCSFHEFSFDQSFWSHSGFMEDDEGSLIPDGPESKYADQPLVYTRFGRRVLDNAWKGYHCCLFAYGQTGAGKSYSMVGGGSKGPNKGIIPITCEEIFNRIGQQTGGDPGGKKRFEVTFTMCEIYNETVQDLLTVPDDRPRQGLQIRECKSLGIYVDGVQKRAVDSYAAIELAIEDALENRTIGSTLMNATSSRAHTVTTIEFKQISIQGNGKETSKHSMINLVDLAGSERTDQTGATGDRLKEGAMINKSLSALGNVIEKLAERSKLPKQQQKHFLIPYRDSKLTRLLQNALGGSSKTIMICALSPANVNYEETLSTLRWADRAKKIKNIAHVTASCLAPASN
eukprot:TRINITY_DN28759_c0_g1_i1.p1 TRINITY_DN28759_c0_g1~~TRINITY_DN28759_c0_g1_i1.p1  ORF type:complete len:431 (+),score=50.69 TRINITY_DN28759_c0_g1_i1:281-1573(+)